MVKEGFRKELNKVQEGNIQILEVDELFTYVKKEKIKHMYLLMSTENQAKLLISK